MPKLSNFHFSFNKKNAPKFNNLTIPFKITINSMPSTNIHAFIKQNRYNKTTILNKIINAITNPKNNKYFFSKNNKLIKSKIPKEYFQSLISISFNAFNPFTPPKKQPNPAKDTQYFYIKLKNAASNNLKSLSNLRLKFISAFINYIKINKKKQL